MSKPCFFSLEKFYVYLESDYISVLLIIGQLISFIFLLNVNISVVVVP